MPEVSGDAFPIGFDLQACICPAQTYDGNPSRISPLTRQLCDPNEYDYYIVVLFFTLAEPTILPCIKINNLIYHFAAVCIFVQEREFWFWFVFSTVIHLVIRFGFGHRSSTDKNLKWPTEFARNRSVTSWIFDKSVIPFFFFSPASVIFWFDLAPALYVYCCQCCADH